MATIRDAATVILLRDTDAGVETLLLRRSRGASFMASAFVFPGGGVDAGERNEVAALRELFEEAGVLIAVDAAGVPATAAQAVAIRTRVVAGEPATAVLAEAGLSWATDTLHPWSHWITPSVEPKRFSATFWVARLPAGQQPAFDATETVEQRWTTCADALANVGELRLPPPQIRTLYEMLSFDSVADVMTAALHRALAPASILPRTAAHPRGLCLLLPWDPQYNVDGQGDALPMNPVPAWAAGPTRFVLDGTTWRYQHADEDAASVAIALAGQPEAL